MQWEFVVLLVLAVPVVLFPVALIWYLNLGGLYSALKQMRRRRLGLEVRSGQVAEDQLGTGVAIAEKRRQEKELLGARH